MKLLFAFLWLAASTVSPILDETQTVAAGDWAFRDIPLHQQSARVSANYEVLEGSPKVRLALMLREDLDRMSDDLSDSIAATPAGRRGSLSDTIRRSGDYALVLDNRDGKQPATVHLKAWLDPQGPNVTGLSHQKQIVVMVASLAGFLGIVGFSARRIWHGMRR